MGISPKLWGNEGWHFIHMTALNYPEKPTEQDKKNYTQFLESLVYTLPCEGCSFNWLKKLRETPPNLNSRKEFFEWTVDRHNEVNKSNGKREISYDEALKKINTKKSVESLKDSFIIATILTACTAVFYKIFKK
jgi:hypothetical protein